MPHRFRLPSRYLCARRRLGATATGLGLALLASCGSTPAAVGPRAAPDARPAVHDRGAALPTGPAAARTPPGTVVAGRPVQQPATQATRAGARAPGPVAAAPVAPAPVAAGQVAPAPLAAAPVASAPVAPAPVPAAPAAPEMTTEQVWAAERARHRSPRAWYGATEPRSIDCLHLKCIALTFDDGPAASTDELLDVLSANGVRATFFVQGRNVRNNPATLVRTVWEGHEVGNHTWDHRSLVGRSTADLAHDLLKTADVITRTAGVRPTLVRPPFGATDATLGERVPAPLVLWSVDTDDWKDHDPALVTQRVVERAAPGSVVLMHDVYRESVQAVPAVIDHFRREGYVFVTVTEMFGGKLRPGREYHGREAAVAKARAADQAAGRVRSVPPEFAAPSPAGMGAATDPAGRVPFPPAPTEPAPLEPGEVDAQRGVPPEEPEVAAEAVPAEPVPTEQAEAVPAEEESEPMEPPTPGAA